MPSQQDTASKQRHMVSRIAECEKEIHSSPLTAGTADGPCRMHEVFTKALELLSQPADTNGNMQAQTDVTTVKKSTGLKGKDVIIEYYNVSHAVPAACNLHGVSLLHQQSPKRRVVKARGNF
jgi:hypothetical protein